MQDEEEPKVRTLFLTYEAKEQDADTFMIVIGSIAENFRGVEVVEFQDDSMFTEDEDPRVRLHEMVTAATRLTESQKMELDEFAARLAQWDGDDEESGK